MSRNEKAALEMLDAIDQARSGGINYDELEERLWRLLDAVDTSFPAALASRVEDLVLQVRRLQRFNVASAGPRDADPDRGTEVIFQEVTSALHRYLG